MNGVHFFRAILAGMIAALSFTWRLVWTPLGWIWRREPAAPVTPAQAVAAREEGRKAVEAYDDVELDNALRYYLLWRLIYENPSRGGRPPDQPAPSLDSIPARIAHWCRAMDYREVSRCFGHLGPPEHLLMHIKADNGRIAGVPTIDDVRSRPVPKHLQTSAEKTMMGRDKAGAGGGPKNAPPSNEQDMEAMIEQALDDLKMQLSPSGPRPR